MRTSERHRISNGPCSSVCARRLVTGSNRSSSHQLFSFSIAAPHHNTCSARRAASIRLSDRPPTNRAAAAFATTTRGFIVAGAGKHIRISCAFADFATAQAIERSQRGPKSAGPSQMLAPYCALRPQSLGNGVCEASSPHNPRAFGAQQGQHLQGPQALATPMICRGAPAGLLNGRAD